LRAGFVDYLTDVGWRVNGLVANLDDHIPGLQATFGSPAGRVDFGNHDAAIARRPHVYTKPVEVKFTEVALVKRLFGTRGNI
jgi:hypothetical protein